MRSFVFVFLSLLLVAGCQKDAIDAEIPRATPETFSQWAATATASSQYGLPDWGSERATGEPDVDGCVDDSRAWASGRGNGTEWLLLEYRVPVFATRVNIFQSFGRGAISRVTLYDAEENSEVIWEGEDSNSPCPGILSVPISEKPYRVSLIRIDLDESRTAYWNQIDSVQLIGYK